MGARAAIGLIRLIFVKKLKSNECKMRSSRIMKTKSSSMNNQSFLRISQNLLLRLEQRLAVQLPPDDSPSHRVVFLI